jgi:hypothetical protein
MLLIGYTAIIERYSLQVPVEPRAGTAPSRDDYSERQWRGLILAWGTVPDLFQHITNER